MTEQLIKRQEDQSDSWTNMEGELDAYIPLKMGSWLRQGVLAFDYWTSYSPTWDQQSDGTVDNRPPAYTGPTLGGLWRMRGYPSQRFNDKAAIYYAAELRLIPDWNPFDLWSHPYGKRENAAYILKNFLLPAVRPWAQHPASLTRFGKLMKYENASIMGD